MAKSLLLFLFTLMITSSSGTTTCIDDDYFPCSCYYNTTTNIAVVFCDLNITLSTVQFVLRNSSDNQVTELHLSLPPDEMSVPADVVGGKLLYKIEIICPESPSSPLQINPAAFRASRGTVSSFSLTGCDLSSLNYAFLNGFSAIDDLVLSNCTKMGNFQTLPTVLPTLIRLIIRDSPDLVALENLPPLKPLRNIYINNCPQLTTLQLPELPGVRSLEVSKSPKFRQWTIFKTQLAGLHEIRFASDGLNYRTVNEMLNQVMSSPVAETLAVLSLERNRLDQIPSQIKQLKRLSHFNLDYNRIEQLFVNSLNMKAPKVKLISLAGNGLYYIESGAIQGNLGGSKIILKNNNISTLDSSVFRPLLQKMEAFASTESESESGKIAIHQNSIRCDCRLQWLIRDYRYLMDYFETLPVCTNGTAFLALDPNAYDDCAEGFKFSHSPPRLQPVRGEDGESSANSYHFSSSSLSQLSCLFVINVVFIYLGRVF